MRVTETQKADAATKGVLLALGLAMFVYVIDTTIMGVSISDLVTDLNTDIGSVQMAITVYTLTMAAFTVTGAKLGRKWGALKAFRIGLVVYGIGTVTTAMAPNIAMLLIGWSVLEGLGSALIVPAINTLVRSNYDGQKRAAAYGTLGGVAAAGAAIGPIVGGWLTTTYTWRIAFWVEAVIVVLVLLGSKKIKESERLGAESPIDKLGILVSAIGLGLFVFGILQTSALGWSSPVVWGLIVAGLALLIFFTIRSLRQEREGKDPLVRLSMMKKSAMGAGVPVMVAQTFAQQGVLFLVPLFAQLVLGLDALKTGLAVLPLSLGVMLFSVTTSKLGHKIAPRFIIQVGLLAIFVGSVLFAVAVPGADSGSDFALSMFVIGAGIGLISAQLPNLMLGAVAQDETSEAAGLQATAQNLGMSLGTAVAGSLVLVVLGLGFTSGVADSTVLADADREGIELLLEQNLDSVGTEFEDLLADRPPEIADEVRSIAKQSSDGAFQATAIALGIISMIGFVISIKLPSDKLSGTPTTELARATVAIPKLQLDPGETSEQIIDLDATSLSKSKSTST